MALVAVKSKAKRKYWLTICAYFVIRFLIVSGILIYCAIFPALYFVGPQLKWFSKTEISYAAIMYYLVFNTLILIGLGYCIVGCVAYPYSNRFFN